MLEHEKNQLKLKEDEYLEVIRKAKEAEDFFRIRFK
jgi:hypothetical protein